MINSKATTKIQAAILVTLIAIVGLGVGIYLLLRDNSQSSETIKIGILADLDTSAGKSAWQGAVLAAEQLNAEGGILGKQIEVVGEDHDVMTEMDMNKVSNSLTRLIAYHKVDFVIGQTPGDAGFVCQNIIAEQQIIFFGFGGVSDEYTQRVSDDYDRYKYYFNLVNNQTIGFQGIPESLLSLKENTGFNKVAYLAEELYASESMMNAFKYALADVYGFEVVYGSSFPTDTVDFSSYFAAAEAAGAEIIVPFIGTSSGIAFIKEYHDRQSPMVVYSGVLSFAGMADSWEMTDGKCEYISTFAYPIVVGYPLTSKTIPSRDAYIQRWNENPTSSSATVYDTIRFVLSDAIERAGTIETPAVIEALEKTSVETSLARTFAFTSSHDILFGKNVNDHDYDYRLIIIFQWQNGKQMPVWPEKIMEESGATYTFPDWPGPWD